MGDLLWETNYDFTFRVRDKNAADVNLNSKASTINILAKKWIVRVARVSSSFVPKKVYHSKDKIWN